MTKQQSLIRIIINYNKAEMWKQCSGSSSPAMETAPRIERKIIEKNRRNRMKNLYGNLISLLPHHDSKLEVLPLPDQIDEAIAYIRRLRTNLDKIRLKKETLLARTKTHPSSSCMTSSENQSTSKTVPLVEVHDMGPNVAVILAQGLDNYSKFHHIIRMVNQNGDEISGATFIRHGNSTVQVLQDNKQAASKSTLGFGGSTDLKQLVSGRSSRSEAEESQLDISDYEIESNIWGFQTTQVSTAGIHSHCRFST